MTPTSAAATIRESLSKTEDIALDLILAVVKDQAEPPPPPPPRLAAPEVKEALQQAFGKLSRESRTALWQRIHDLNKAFATDFYDTCDKPTREHIFRAFLPE